MKQSSLAMQVGLNDKNVFPPFFPSIYAFYQASRFRLLAYEIFLFFLSFLLALARFFFLLVFQHKLPRIGHEFYNIN